MNMKKLNKCEQNKCGFLIMGVGCKSCKSCKAEPYLIDDNCEVCWNCSHDEGILRWDENEDENETIIQEIEKEEEKPIEIRA
jgi:hypothetical protein